MPSILLVDDDRELCSLLTTCFVREGLNVEVAHDGRTGLNMALSGDYDLAILDVMLPELTGLQILKELRATSSMGVLMLTARGEEIDRIVGLDYGADDYLTKPCTPRELMARVRALVRRLNPSDESEYFRQPQRLEFGDLELDEGTRICRREGQILELTTAEFDLLAYFMRRSGRIIHRKELLKSILGRRWSPFDRSIDVHVSNLRRKLGCSPDGTERIRAVRSVGYLFARTAADLVAN